LNSSNIGQTLIKLSKDSQFKHPSDRPIRHGYMAAVIKIANVISKSKDNKDEVVTYIKTLGDDWKEFVDGEFKRSNETNNRSLGG